MKVSEQWLRAWCDPALSSEDLAKKITLGGLEIDTVVPVAHAFTGVVVAHVMATEPHPEADRLTLCQVDAGLSEPLSIVCGAKNVRPGLKVALAMVGAQLAPDFIIKRARLRGQWSEGMLCSAEELGMQDQAEGILELPSSAPIGMDVRTYLSLNDHIFEMSITPNRGDCLSVYGIARDVAGLTGAPLRPLDIEPMPGVPMDDLPCVRVQADEACPYYAFRVIRGLSTTLETPLDVVERLRRSGLTPIHPVVDYLHEVMIEYGQPMHAFDLNLIGQSLTLRYAKPEETLTLLQGQTVTLDASTVVMADERGPLAMAGVMGGLSSAVTPATVDIFIESAHFTPSALSGVARRFGLTTDASQRFERGVDPALIEQALTIVTRRIVDTLGGVPSPIQWVTHPPKSDATCVLFKPERFEQITGVPLARDFIATSLRRLGFVCDDGVSPWKVTVPSYRFDIAYDVDLIEEVLRVYGYDRIQPVLHLDVAHPLNVPIKRNIQHTMQKVLHCFQHRGYHEAIHYSFVDPALQRFITQDASTMVLLNPISSELSEMRLSLWPGLLASVLYNQHRQQTNIRLCEIGVVFPTTKEGRVDEVLHFGGIATGMKGLFHWGEPTSPIDFFDVKGDVESWFLSAWPHQKLRFKAAEHPALHPGQSAQIVLNDDVVGWIGAVHPACLNALGIETSVFVFEWKLSEADVRTYYEPISKYPCIRRDLSLLMPTALPVEDVLTCIRQGVEPSYLKSLSVFDYYLGEHLPEGQKSIAVTLLLQHPDRTWVDEDIQLMMTTILKTLQTELGVTLRE